MTKVKNPKWAKKPRVPLVNCLDLLKPGTVLDIGGSDGVNDLYLAEQGFHVTNLDKDKESLEKFLKVAQENNLEVDTIHANLVRYSLNTVYDNIISFFVLHFLPYNLGRSYMQSIIDHTEEGGLNILLDFTAVGTMPTKHASQDRFFVEDDLILKLYLENGFDILNYRKRVITARSGDEQQTYLLVARKN